MDEYAGIIHSFLSQGPLSDVNAAVEVLANAEIEFRKKINDMLDGEYDEKEFAAARNANSEISRLIGIFKVFFNQWSKDNRLTRNSSALSLLACVFSGENEYLGEYNKVCYLLKKNLPDSVGEEKDLLKAPEPFKSEIFDD
jgi:hypothetical protein